MATAWVGGALFGLLLELSVRASRDPSHGVALGPDPEPHIEMAKKFIDAGYTHLWFHQIGPDQDGFFRFYEQEVLPKLG